MSSVAYHLISHLYGVSNRFEFRDRALLTGFEAKLELETIMGVPHNLITLLQRGLVIQDSHVIDHRNTIEACILPKGGKGGFGSMLRALGAQIEKTTNRDACRDLSGRRLRDINEEKKLKKWVANKAKREKEQEERKKAKLEKLAQTPKHEFRDPKYDKLRSELTEKLYDSVDQGMKASSSKAEQPSGSSTKRKINSSTVTKAKKKKMDYWLKMEGVSSSDESSHGSENEDSNDNGSNAATNEQTNDIDSTSQPSTGPEDRVDVENEESQVVTSQVVEASLARDDVNEEPVTSEVSKVESEEKNGDSLKIPEENGSTKIVEFTPIVMGDYSTVEKLKLLGLDQLKFELQLRGMKCGGNLEQRAARLDSVRGLSTEQIPANLLAKKSKS